MLDVSLWWLGAALLALPVLGRLIAKSLGKSMGTADTPGHPAGKQDAVPADAPLLQGCVIPYRNQRNQLELCLISLNSQTGWGFPKGMVDAPETVSAAALREAYEEAGIRGTIAGEALGSYSYLKRDLTLHVTVFLMHVTTVERRWPERRVRERRFCSVEQARALLVVPEQRQLLELALKRLTP